VAGRVRHREKIRRHGREHGVLAAGMGRDSAGAPRNSREESAWEG
jgi:hypothetical protein